MLKKGLRYSYQYITGSFCRAVFSFNNTAMHHNKNKTKHERYIAPMKYSDVALLYFTSYTNSVFQKYKRRLNLSSELPTTEFVSLSVHDREF